MVKVNFSSAMQAVTKGNREVEIDFHGGVGGLFNRLSEVFGDEFSRRIFDNGKIRRYINVYVDGKDIRFSEGQDTRVGDGSVVDVVPAVSGG
jgi:molybdopterin converting factor small subunit